MEFHFIRRFSVINSTANGWLGGFLEGFSRGSWLYKAKQLEIPDQLFIPYREHENDLQQKSNVTGSL
jgi:hypothetical protein